MDTIENLATVTDEPESVVDALVELAEPEHEPEDPAEYPQLDYRLNREPPRTLLGSLIAMQQALTDLWFGYLLMYAKDYGRD